MRAAVVLCSLLGGGVLSLGNSRMVTVQAPPSVLWVEPMPVPVQPVAPTEPCADVEKLKAEIAVLKEQLQSKGEVPAPPAVASANPPAVVVRTAPLPVRIVEVSTPAVFASTYSVSRRRLFGGYVERSRAVVAPLPVMAQPVFRAPMMRMGGARRGGC